VRGGILPSGEERDVRGPGAFYTKVFHPYVARFQHLVAFHFN
jgi:hypothetical protein